MQGFFKTEMTNINQILFCTDPQVSVGIIVDDSGIDTGADGRKVVKAGTPMYGSLLDRATPFTTSAQTVDPTATAEVEGTGITAATVTAATFSTAVSGASGTYVFTYDETGTTWKLGTSSVTLNTYGIVATGSAADGDKITVVFVAGYTSTAVGVLLHDVDVTAGDNNGTLLIFGFVNINRIDETTAAALLAVENALDGKVFICAD